MNSKDSNRRRRRRQIQETLNLDETALNIDENEIEIENEIQDEEFTNEASKKASSNTKRSSKRRASSNQDSSSNGSKKNSKNKKRTSSKKSSNKYIAFLLDHKKIIISLILLLFAIFGGFFLYSQVYVANRDANRPLSILLVGSDTAEHRGGNKVEKTDSLMVLTFNPSTYKVEVTSIPRDTSVDYTCSDPGYQDQINEAFFVSGKNMDCLTDTVSNFLNVPIDYYAKVNMDQITEIIDSVGGLTIKAHAADGYLEQINVDSSVTYEWVDGETYEMQGDEALTYARGRHDSEKDYGRGIRQQQVISALVQEILSQPYNIKLIDSLFGFVETDMPILLIYRYYEYVFNIKDQLAKFGDDEVNMKVGDLPEAAWKGIFDYTGFKYKQVDKDSVEEFEEFLKSYKGDPLAGYFLNSHQFFNEAYNGYYNVVEEQLQTISDALRSNLDLKTEKVKLPSYPYGDNNALGLLNEGGSNKNSAPQYDTEICEDGSIVELGYCPSNVIIDEPAPVVPEEPAPITTETCWDGSVMQIGTCPPEPVEIIDTDGDGIEDSKDPYPNGEDKIDTDQDGIPDLTDPYPNNEDTIDTDGDGVVDINDPYPNDEDIIDSDGDGIPDISDDTPNGPPVEETP